MLQHNTTPTPASVTGWMCRATHRASVCPHPECAPCGSPVATNQPTEQGSGMQETPFLKAQARTRLVLERGLFRPLSRSRRPGVSQFFHFNCVLNRKWLCRCHSSLWECAFGTDHKIRHPVKLDTNLDFTRTCQFTSTVPHPPLYALTATSPQPTDKQLSIFRLCGYCGHFRFRLAKSGFGSENWLVRTRPWSIATKQLSCRLVPFEIHFFSVWWEWTSHLHTETNRWLYPNSTQVERCNPNTQSPLRQLGLCLVTVGTKINRTMRTHVCLGHLQRVKICSL